VVLLFLPGSAVLPALGTTCAAPVMSDGRAQVAKYCQRNFIAGLVP